MQSKAKLGLVYTSDGSDGSGVVSGVGIGRKFWSSVNRHDGSGIVSLAFSVSLAFICKHSRWRTREMTRDCCFCFCFLFSYDEEDVCNRTKEGEGCSHYFCAQLTHSSMILTNKNIKQMKLYSLLLYIPVWSSTCLATSSHASLFLLLYLKSLQDLS